MFMKKQGPEALPGKTKVIRCRMYSDTQKVVDYWRRDECSTKALSILVPMWAPEPSGHGGEENNSQPPPGLEAPIIQSVAQRSVTELTLLALCVLMKCNYCSSLFNSLHQGKMKLEVTSDQ